MHQLQLRWRNTCAPHFFVLEGQTEVFQVLCVSSDNAPTQGDHGMTIALILMRAAAAKPRRRGLLAS